MEIRDVKALLDANPKGTFLSLLQFNGSSVGACSITGVSPVWEMHPDTDELFFVLDGEMEMTLLGIEGPRHEAAPAGSVFVVPKGVWHKPAAPGGAKFLYLTPGETLHSDAEDPRIASA